MGCYENINAIRPEYGNLIQAIDGSKFTKERSAFTAKVDESEWSKYSGYFLVIRHCNEKSPMYTWFSNAIMYDVTAQANKWY